MNTQELYKKNEEMMRNEWFKDHVPELCFHDHGVMKIKWRKPGTWNYAVVYMIDEKMGHLCVYGDLGEAIYQWNPPIGLDFLGGLDLGYFSGKCQSSSCGPRGKEWNQELAQSYLKQYLLDMEPGVDRKDFRDEMPDMLEACFSESDWHAYLRDSGYDYFGDSYYEFGDIGKTISLRTQSHLVGLRMIVQGVKSGKFEDFTKIEESTKLSS
jgi:hypothetical protein